MNRAWNNTVPVWEKPESRRLEFKESFSKGDQVAKTVIAFANGAGGKIIFGIKDDSRKVTGIPETKLFPLEEQIANHIFSKCSPNIIPEIYIQAVQDKTLLVVEIFPGSHKPYFLKTKGKHKGTYIRIGSTNKLASIETIEELERQRMNISFDAVPATHVKMKEISLETFLKDYKEATGRALTQKKLKNLGLIHCDHEQLYPTHAAILLCDSIKRKQLFPNAKIECARFKGTNTQVFIDQATVDWPIHACVEPCIAFVKKNTRLGSKIGEVFREDKWEYPLEAIREALGNAVIHRDYSILGSDIKLAIFDDMLEITSPVPLPDTISIEELGTGRSEIRNRILAPIFKDLKIIEAWGTGIQKIKQALKYYPEIELVMHEVGHAFQIQFRKKIADRTSTGQVPDKYRTRIVQDADKVKLLKYCREARLLKEMMSFMKLKHRETFMNNYMRPLLEANCISMTIPDKPKSPSQRYIITQDGEALLNK